MSDILHQSFEWVILNFPQLEARSNKMWTWPLFSRDCPPALHATALGMEVCGKPEIKRVEKNNAKAELCRVTGNAYLGAGKLAEAINVYNQGICSAEPGSELMAFCYANRALVYMRFGMLKSSLESMRLARAAGYPQHLIHKLEERELSIAEQIRKKETKCPTSMESFAQLSFPTNATYPALAECLEIRQNENFGRHIATTGDLQVGQIIAIEEPYCAIFLREENYIRCANCLSDDAAINLIPCKNCTAAMFCDQKCYDEAQATFHGIECGIIDFIQTFGSSALAIRSTIKAIQSFDSLDELMAAFKTAVEDVNDLNCPQNTDCGRFQLNCKHQTNERERNMMEKLKWVMKASPIRVALLDQTPLGDLFVTLEQREFLLELIFRQLLICETRNSLPVEAIFNITNFLNHSCAPNVWLDYKYNRIVGVVMRPIQKGDQLFIAHGWVFLQIFELSFDSMNFPPPVIGYTGEYRGH